MKRRPLSERGTRAGERIEPIYRRVNLSRGQACTLCNLAAGLRVTQGVNGNKSIHVMLAKQLRGG